MHFQSYCNPTLSTQLTEFQSLDAMPSIYFTANIKCPSHYLMPHSVDISGFFCYSDFTWNHFGSFCFYFQKLPIEPFQQLLNFREFLTFSSAKFPEHQNSEARASRNVIKWQFLTFWSPTKLISRKIRVGGKLLIWYTV